TTGKYRYYIHGAYWHNNFGQPMSHGCVNVAYDNMEDLYWYAQIGTKVIVE
ncbi:MAG: L,D-transpeptidase, partial [bacterium]